MARRQEQRLGRNGRQKAVAGARPVGYTRRQFESRGLVQNQGQELQPMEWVTPQHETVDLYCEVSSYANAEL